MSIKCPVIFFSKNFIQQLGKSRILKPNKRLLRDFQEYIGGTGLLYRRIQDFPLPRGSYIGDIGYIQEPVTPLLLLFFLFLLIIRRSRDSSIKIRGKYCQPDSLGTELPESVSTKQTDPRVQQCLQHDWTKHRKVDTIYY